MTIPGFEARSMKSVTVMPKLEIAALHLALLAATETEGNEVHKTAVAIRAYLWAVENRTPQRAGTLSIYPSVPELRKAMYALKELQAT